MTHRAASSSAAAAAASPSSSSARLPGASTRELMDEMIARQMQQQEDEQQQQHERESSGGDSASSSSSSSSRRDALRQLMQEGPSRQAGSNGGRMDSAFGDENAFFVNRVAAQTNRCALSLSVLLSGDVRRCIMLNYCWQLDWLADTFPQLATYPQLDLIMGTPRGDKRPNGPQKLSHSDLPNATRWTPPMPMEFGTHHSKMILLVYHTGIRVIVCTANFIAIDWVWKNNVTFVQDFPLKNQYSQPTSLFEDDLLDYFSSYRDMRCPLEIDSLRQFDYAAAKAILIPSVPGRHTGAKLHRYGHMRLRAHLSKLPLDPKFLSAPVTCQYSSVGSISEEWLTNELRVSLAAGKRTTSSDDAASSSSSSAAAAAAGPAPTASSALMSAAHAVASLPPIRLIWPTVESVRQSLEGWSAGGSLCCSSKNLKQFFFKATASGELAWVVITSANLSGAAWGQLQKQSTQLQIRSYEMGVLFHPAHYARAMQILKARRQQHFTCTPDNPIRFAADTPAYFKDAATTTTTTRVQGGAGGPVTALSSPWSGSSPAPSLPPPPVVRFVLLPPLPWYEPPTTPATPVAAAAAASAQAVKRKRSMEECTDLTGDEDNADGAPTSAAPAAAAAAAKKARSDAPPSTAVSTTAVTHSSASVIAAPASSAAAAASSAPFASAASSALVHTVVCPLPYAVTNCRPYVFGKDEPWTWDQPRHVLDCRGNPFAGVGNEED